MSTQNSTEVSWKRAVIAVTMVLAAWSVLAVAQSGRKVPRKPDSRETVPAAPKEDADDKANTQKDSPATISIMVASDLYDIVSDSSVLSGIVTEGILERLGDSRAVRATSMGDRVNRKEASDAAKKSSDGYVLWFQLRSDGTVGSRSTTSNSQYYQSLYVDYAIFTPGTGKQKSMGHVYQRQRVVGSPLPGPTSTAWGAEYSLKWAGRETADRLLDSIGVVRPQSIPH